MKNVEAVNVILLWNEPLPKKSSKYHLGISGEAQYWETINTVPSLSFAKKPVAFWTISCSERYSTTYSMLSFVSRPKDKLTEKWLTLNGSFQKKNVLHSERRKIFCYKIIHFGYVDTWIRTKNDHKGRDERDLWEWSGRFMLGSCCSIYFGFNFARHLEIKNIFSFRVPIPSFLAGRC